MVAEKQGKSKTRQLEHNSSNAHKNLKEKRVAVYNIKKASLMTGFHLSQFYQCSPGNRRAYAFCTQLSFCGSPTEAEELGNRL